MMVVLDIQHITVMSAHIRGVYYSFTSKILRGINLDFLPMKANTVVLLFNLIFFHSANYFVIGYDLIISVVKVKYT